ARQTSGSLAGTARWPQGASAQWTSARSRRIVAAFRNPEARMTGALAVKLIAVACFLASAIFIHYRGRVRHRFARQLTDHSTFLAPYSALVYLFSRVPAKPYLDRKDFPELDLLRDNWQTIRDEGVRLLDEGYVRAAASYNDL